MTILLAGSTGFLGSYLLKSFVESGYTVIGLKRTNSNTYRIDEYLNKKELIETGEYIAYVNNIDKILKLKEFFPFLDKQETLE